MNRYRIILYLFFVLFGTLSAFSQSWESVRTDTAYLYGEGFGTSKAEADRFALNDLISKISLQVSSTTTSEIQESVVNGNLDSKETFGMLMNTYSQATLTNTDSFVLLNDPDAEEAHVVRFIKRSEIKRIFENRRLKIESMMHTAIRAESKGKIDVALKHLYWGLILTKSLQYPSEAYFVDEDKNRHLLMTWIPEKLNDIFSELDVKTVSRNKGEVELSFHYKGIPVNSLDYTYFDGSDWSSLYSAEDGAGVLDMPPHDIRDFYQIKFEYEYRGEAHIDDELESVMGLVKGFRLPASRVDVKALPEKRPVEVVSNSSAQATTNNFDMLQSLNSLGEVANTFKNNSFSDVPAEIYKMPLEIEDSLEYKKILTKVVAAIKVGAKESVAGYFTEEGLDIYERLLLYGQARIVGHTDFSFYRLGTDVIARGLQMSFSFKNGSRKAFVEDVVFTFDAEKKINNIAFGLGKTANDDILGKGVWPEVVRLAIVQFLENYQTAYALKRLDYIEGVFDDDAVIITGNYVPRKAKIADGGGYNIKREVKYTRYDKQAYLKYLAHSFESKEFINIRFANTEVRKNAKGGEEYNIQLYQEYYSSNYGDKGYLFLLVDMNDPDAPVIKVRTWQPERDPNFGIYGPEMFD